VTLPPSGPAGAELLAPTENELATVGVPGKFRLDVHRASGIRSGQKSSPPNPAHRGTCEVDAAGIVDETIEDGIDTTLLCSCVVQRRNGTRSKLV
jgi:hypothetical protein